MVACAEHCVANAKSESVRVWLCVLSTVMCSFGLGHGEGCPWGRFCICRRFPARARKERSAPPPWCTAKSSGVVHLCERALCPHIRQVLEQISEPLGAAREHPGLTAFSGWRSPKENRSDPASKDGD